eukprot:4987359-Amphidinium_carterae.1
MKPSMFIALGFAIVCIIIFLESYSECWPAVKKPLINKKQLRQNSKGKCDYAHWLSSPTALELTDIHHQENTLLSAHLGIGLFPVMGSCFAYCLEKLTIHESSE